MSKFLQDSIDFILHGGSGEELFERIERLRIQNSVAELKKEVQYRNLAAENSQPLVVDFFILDDLYNGRIDGLPALQIVRTLVEDDELWKRFQMIHKAHSGLEGEIFEDIDDSQVQEARELYSGEMELVEFSSRKDSHHLKPLHPEGQHNLLLKDQRQEYLGGGLLQNREEQVLLQARQYQLLISWLPARHDLKLRFAPPQCDESTFMKGRIQLITPPGIIDPSRRDFSPTSANVLFAEISEPWGGRLRIDRDIVPHF